MLTIIAESLGIPVLGVNLPNHFLLAYVDEYNILRFIDKATNSDADDSDILFYMNAFSSGAMVHKDEIRTYLERMKLDYIPEYTEPCSNRAMISRLLNNLINSYDRLGYPEKVEELRILHTAVSQFSDNKFN